MVKLPWRPDPGARVLLGAMALAAALAGTTCKVINEDHCANQDLPGNEWCRELNRATPYCSPCRRDYHGCVDFEPFACEGYDNEIGDTPDDGPAASSTTDEPASTGQASTSDASSSGGGGSSGDASSGSETAGSSG